MGFKEDNMDDGHVSEMKHSRHKTTEMKHKTAIVTKPADIQHNQHRCSKNSRDVTLTSDMYHNQQI